MSDDNNGVERRVVHEGRLVRLEDQIARLVADVESEKGTRRRANMRAEAEMKELAERIRALEHKAYWLAGGIAVSVFVANWLFAK